MEAELAAGRAKGENLSWEEAAKQVSLIEIQRLVKQEMTAKWPEFMAGIPSNSLKDE